MGCPGVEKMELERAVRDESMTQDSTEGIMKSMKDYPDWKAD